MKSRSSLATDKAARYMTQLAKHWSHKFPVELTQSTARIPLPIGVCAMVAAPDALVIELDGSPDAMSRLEEVVARHVARFAFREPDLAFVWTRSED